MRIVHKNGQNELTSTEIGCLQLLRLNVLLASVSAFIFIWSFQGTGRVALYWSQHSLGWLTRFQSVTIIGRQGLDTVVKRLEQLHLIRVVELLKGKRMWH